MLSRSETEYSPSPEDVLKMRRAQRRFRSDPDHATKGTPFRTPEEKEDLIKVNRRRTEANLKDAKYHIQEAISGELAGDLTLDSSPNTSQEQPVLESVKPEPSSRLEVPIAQLAPNLRQLVTS